MKITGIDASLIISIIALVSTIFSWFVIHSLSRRRDRLNKRREIRVTYLTDAFRLIEKSSNREEFEHRVLLETALADIHLFGSVEQIKLVKKLANEYVNKGIMDAGDLLTSLRKDLRHELGLEQTAEKWVIFRMIKGKRKSIKLQK